MKAYITLNKVPKNCLECVGAENAGMSCRFCNYISGKHPDFSLTTKRPEWCPISTKKDESEKVMDIMKKIFLPEKEGGLPAAEIKKMFGTVNPDKILTTFSSKDILKHIKEYEKYHK